MEGILKFNLPEEREEFEMAQKGVLYSIALFDLDQYLRSKIKYDTNITEDQMVIYEEIRSKLHELASDSNLEI